MQVRAAVAVDGDSIDGCGVRQWHGVIGVAATVAVASVVALLLVNIFPKDRDADQALAASAQTRRVNETPKVGEPPKVNEAAKTSQVRAPSGAGDKGSTENDEQSERLLQQFMQWRQKSPSTDKP